METLQILGWVYLGIMLGSIFGVMALSLFVGPKIKQYTVDIDELEEEKRLLKAQLNSPTKEVNHNQEKEEIGRKNLSKNKRIL